MLCFCFSVKFEFFLILILVNNGILILILVSVVSDALAAVIGRMSYSFATFRANMAMFDKRFDRVEWACIRSLHAFIFLAKRPL